MDRFKTLYAITICTIYFYIFMEWLFFATKPSFMSSLNNSEKISLLFVSPLPIIILISLIFLIAILFSRILSFAILRQYIFIVLTIIPALIISFSGFLLIDNFTYTILKFGVIKSSGIVNMGYVLLLVAFIFISYRYVLKVKSVSLFVLVISILLILITIISTFYNISKSENLVGNIVAKRNSKRLPNIILINGDGLNADNLSLYGYKRDTTPFLRKLARESLLADNFFANSNDSGAAVASMMTGSLPTENKLFYPPNILRGEYSYRHFPAILQNLGYDSIDISVTHFVDALDLNMKHSYNRSYASSIKETIISKKISTFLPNFFSYFIEIYINRLTSRIIHIMGINSMSDSYSEVVKYKEFKNKDEHRIKVALNFLENANEPFFMHLFLMGTHGPYFRQFKRPIYSRGKKQNKKYMIDFYDDAIIDFDKHVSKVIEKLKIKGVLDNSIIIITTDHGIGHRVDNRLLLLIKFPNSDYEGKKETNIQRLDIPPTVLDYIGINKPRWMKGQSILSSELDPYRVILSTIRKMGTVKMLPGIGLKRWFIDVNKIGPPFYELGMIQAIVCNRLYKLNLNKRVMIISQIKNYSFECEVSKFPSSKDIERFILDHLQKNKYDISSLKSPNKIKYINTINNF